MRVFSETLGWLHETTECFAKLGITKGLHDLTYPEQSRLKSGKLPVSLDICNSSWELTFRQTKNILTNGEKITYLETDDIYTRNRLLANIKEQELRIQHSSWNIFFAFIACMFITGFRIHKCNV